jgi:glycosyltransferase involved in cell wall biosynthesis
MKNVHLGYSHSPQDTRIFYKECISLAREGYEVTYITSTREIGKFNTQLNGVKIITIETIKGSRFKRYLRYLKDLYDIALKQDAEVYHIHEPLLMYVGLKLKKKNKKIIFDSHESFKGYWDDLFFIPKIIRKLLSRLIWKWLIKSIKKADGVISATPFIATQFEEYNIRSIIVNNYPILDNTKFITEDFEERHKIACYAGVVSKIRGVDNIIKAMEDVDGKLIIAGKISIEDRERFRKIDGWDKTEYIGFINRKDINKMYKRSLVGMVTFLQTPNHLHSQPNKLFEYMAAGIPVICSSFPLWQKIIRENECGVCVNETSPNEIAKAINYIFENKGRAKEMGINGRKAIITKYNWNIEKEKLIHYYNVFKELKR